MPSAKVSRSASARAVAWTVVVLSTALATTLVVRDVVASGKADSAAARSEIENPAVLVLEHDGFRYTYHAVTGAEALFDLTRDPGRLVNLRRDRPNMCRRFRGMLMAREKVRDLRELRGRHRDEIEGLRSLGYL